MKWFPNTIELYNWEIEVIISNVREVTTTVSGNRMTFTPEMVLITLTGAGFNGALQGLPRVHNNGSVPFRSRW